MTETLEEQTVPEVEDNLSDSVSEGPSEGPSEDIFQYDYSFIQPGTVKELTVNQLVKLEAELHTARMIWIAYGKNGSVKLSNGTTVDEEIQRLVISINNIRYWFSTVLEYEG